MSSIKKLPMHVCTNFELAYKSKEFQQFEVTQKKKKKNILLYVKQVEKKKKRINPWEDLFGVLYLAFWC